MIIAIWISVWHSYNGISKDFGITLKKLVSHYFIQSSRRQVIVLSSLVSCLEEFSYIFFDWARISSHLMNKIMDLCEFNWISLGSSLVGRNLANPYAKRRGSSYWAIIEVMLLILVALANLEVFLWGRIVHWCHHYNVTFGDYLLVLEEPKGLDICSRL